MEQAPLPCWLPLATKHPTPPKAFTKKLLVSMQFGASIHIHYRQRQDLSQVDPGSFAAKVFGGAGTLFQRGSCKKISFRKKLIL
ncbi:MAG: hypothetical protein IJX19_13180 [Clostridia bacterium]|nr:hypothetical protein [Clostridia bacterium]